MFELKSRSGRILSFGNTIKDSLEKVHVVNSLDLSEETLLCLMGNVREFADCKFINCDLSSSNFCGSIFSNVSFCGSNLSKADLSNCDITGSFRNVNFEYADLNDTVFFEVDLEGADFNRASLHNTEFIACKLDGVFGLPSKVWRS